MGLARVCVCLCECVYVCVFKCSTHLVPKYDSILLSQRDSRPCEQDLRGTDGLSSHIHRGARGNYPTHTHTINYQQGQRSVTESLFFSGFFQIDYNKINLTHLIVGEIYHEMTSIFLSLLCYM